MRVYGGRVSSPHPLLYPSGNTHGNRHFREQGGGGRSALEDMREPFGAFRQMGPLPGRSLSAFQTDTYREANEKAHEDIAKKGFTGRNEPDPRRGGKVSVPQSCPCYN